MPYLEATYPILGGIHTTVGETEIPQDPKKVLRMASGQNMFHETDRFEFEPGYVNRRINVTMLFGRRQD